ncbi:ABC transporter substrate-binding protein [Nocardia sp. BMG51109]|uniref:ABC transporter substrate-binding protein n=1 Tax=Nocardia sp. BMG51109 TaxID=1056816 RepID=UPI000467E83B|nr:ABC transporter substrate-binding protein [Nocardia sp. BMG51109]
MKKLLVCASTLCLLLAGTGCGADTPADQVTVGLATFSAEQVDPSLDQTAGLNYSGPMFDWLIGATPDGALSPATGALESWTPDADATTWTLRLRPGMTWHDGSPVTARDVAFTLRHFTAPEAICSSCVALRSAIRDIAVTDPRTTVLTLTDPTVTLPSTLGPIEGDIKLLPENYYNTVGAKGFSEHPIGSGPWKFAGKRAGESITFERNDRYWDRARVPGFRLLSVQLVPDLTARTLMIGDGSLDVAAVDPNDVPPLRADGTTIHSVEDVGYTALMFFRAQDPQFLTGNRDFRAALAHSVDWDTVIESFYPEGVGKRHTGGAVPFASTTSGARADLAPYRYDPEAARRELRAAGYAGQQLTLYNYSFNLNPEQPTVNEVIAGYWRALGITVKLVPVDWGTIRQWQLQDPPAFDPPAAAGVQAPSTRPSVLNNMRTFMLSHRDGGSIDAYPNPDWIGTQFRQISSIVDEGARDTRLRELNRKLYDDYWSIPIAETSLPFAVGDRVSSWTPTNGSPNDLAYETLTPAG